MRARTVHPRLEPLDDRCLPSFYPSVSYPVGQSAQSMASGDFNRDSIPDLAVADAYGGVRILVGNGDGSLRTAGHYIQGTYGSDIAAGDLNGDGALDLAVVGITHSDVHILLGNGDGSFQAPQSSGPGDGTLNSLAVGDMNSDGTLDLVVGGLYSFSSCGEYGCSGGSFGEVKVLLGHGDGTYSDASRLLMESYVNDIALTDLNGDGKLDVAATGGLPRYVTSGSLQVWLGTGDGRLQSPASYGSNDFRSVAAADVNGDGKVDLAVVDSYWSGDTIGLFLGQGDGTFQAERTLSAFDQYLLSVGVGDFNRDGRVDIAAASRLGDGVQVRLGKGDGTFRAAASFPAGSLPLDLAVVDFNGDGFADLATANDTSNDTSVLLNDGNWPALDAPTVTVSDATVTEGQTGTRNAAVTVSLSAASNQTVTVLYSSADVTATAGADYGAVSGTVSFAPGQTSQSILVPIIGDRVPESDETFAVTLGQSTGASVARGRAVVTIRDDEPLITITDVAKKEGRTGTTQFVFTVRLSVAYDLPVSINFATFDGTAKAGEDYTATSGTLTFAPGQTSKTITVVVRGDKQSEADETFFVNLSGGTNALLVDGTGLGTILNDDH